MEESAERSGIAGKRDCCVPYPYLLVPDGRAAIAEIALAVTAAEADADADADAFFSGNHLTAGMRLLLETGFVSAPAPVPASRPRHSAKRDAAQHGINR